MRHFLIRLQARPRLVISFAVGLLVMGVSTGQGLLVTRALAGWNVAVWLYLVLIGGMMFRADKARLRRTAIAQAEGAATVLILVILASVVSLAGIVAQLSAAKLPGAPHALPHVVFALVTVAGAWLLIPTMFALTYASRYYTQVAKHAPGGLLFPQPPGSASDSAAPNFEPHYIDFLYFSFTLAVASQTADVSICTTPMRRLVLLQSIVSFVFNTAILAFTINIAASLF